VCCPYWLILIFYISLVFCIFHLLIKYKIHSKSISNSNTTYISTMCIKCIINTKYKIKLYLKCEFKIIVFEILHSTVTTKRRSTTTTTTTTMALIHRQTSVRPTQMSFRCYTRFTSSFLVAIRDRKS